MNNRIKISIFTGGSGNIDFINLLKSYEIFDISIIINGYDNGKSTGYLRSKIRNFLGPSDFRKNIINLISDKEQAYSDLKKILNYRFDKITKKNINKITKFNFSFDVNFNKLVNTLPFFLYRQLKNPINNIKKIYSKLDKDIYDLSFGNLIFAGFFLKKNNFNIAITEFKKICNVNENIIDVSNGKNLYLIGINQKGEILRSEEKIVDGSNKSQILEIFLLGKELLNKDLKKISKFNLDKKISFLKKKEILPQCSKILKKTILKSDIIIFGPGTQHSSLYPSYLTKNLEKNITRSKAKKFMITNIYKDKDQFDEKTSDIITKFNYYLNKRKSFENKNYINYYFTHQIDKQDLNKVDKSLYIENDLKNKKTICLNWEKSNGVHFSKLVIENILKKINYTGITKTVYSSVSIIIPNLNEEKKINQVLLEIQNLFINNNITKEIIVVDGGSKDRSIQICKKFQGIKLYQLLNKGRGDCIQHGIKRSKGDIVIIFPSDGEYKTQEIAHMFSEFKNNLNIKVIMGNRVLKCIDIDDKIKKIYKKKYFSYLVSKLGGKLINILFLILYNRNISDPFTTFQGFNGNLIRSLNLNSSGVEANMEYLIQLIKKNYYIHQLPVEYFPRHKSEGKKINAYDGIKCILTLLLNKI